MSQSRTPKQMRLIGPTPSVVWFKRDMRLADHAALVAASEAGPVLPLYVAEPHYWELPDTSFRQWEFLRGALVELQSEIVSAGGTLSLHNGSVIEALRNLYSRYGQFRLFSHMETGNAWTFRRDSDVRAWCKSTDVEFLEFQQYGIWRGSSLNRDKWARSWDALMAEPLLGVPSDISWVENDHAKIPDSKQLGLVPDGITQLQKPGRKAALQTLNDFLYERGEPYQKGMSSPVSGELACSRLSPHLVAGSLSMREIYQATRARQAEIADLPKAERGTWPSAMKSFTGRLHWHCHFMQKLEAEPEIEWSPMARIYDGLRASPNDDTSLNAFAEGRTGYPFVDACMRYLKATGWINFRMRAMLMSFASYNLWLPWQQSGKVLARFFTDYEPGIHWPQCQMQSGETGINSVRIYSPVKQGYDQDPTGDFTRRWVPELDHLEGKELQEPWTCNVPPTSYPERVVDHVATSREAKTRIYALRGTAGARDEALQVFEKHGSRKSRALRTPSKKRRASNA